MKVTLINTSDSGGGAALACRRLMKALESQHADVEMLVQHKNSREARIHGIDEHVAGRLKASYDFYAERLPFMFFQEKDETVRFAFSTAHTGTNISKKKEIVDADILHLHWINSGFLSINNLQQLADLKKPIVWTLHDMWAFTGGCHYSGSCDHFTIECGNCPFLKNPHKNDISHKGWIEKKGFYNNTDKMVFVSCSNWLGDIARQSSLIGDFRIETIPNPIDTDTFSKKNKVEARAKWKIDPDVKIILFGAANIMDRRKGLWHLVDALNIYKNSYQGQEAVEIVIFGKNKSFDTSDLPFRVHNLSVISSQNDMAELYSLADIFILPSLEDNLPNTVMESMACSTPVVAFNSGGIQDMVDHQVNGYLAAHRSAQDLAYGIHWTLNNRENLAVKARSKVMENFTHEIVARQYMDLYQSLLNG